MRDIIVNVGISGSGKSTWTAEFLKKDMDYLRINRDDVRKTLVKDLGGYYQRFDPFRIEGIVTTIEDAIFWEVVSSRKLVIIDNTNLSEKYIKRWSNLIDSFNLVNDLDLKMKFKLFPIDLSFAKARVLMRDFAGSEDMSKVVYIDKQYEQYKRIENHLVTNFKDSIL